MLVILIKFLFSNMIIIQTSIISTRGIVADAKFCIELKGAWYFNRAPNSHTNTRVLSNQTFYQKFVNKIQIIHYGHQYQPSTTIAKDDSSIDPSCSYSCYRIILPDTVFQRYIHQLPLSDVIKSYYSPSCYCSCHLLKNKNVLYQDCSV